MTSRCEVLRRAAPSTERASCRESQRAQAVDADAIEDLDELFSSVASLCAYVLADFHIVAPM